MSSSFFHFGTKAENLERISPLLNNSVVCELIYFTLNSWRLNPHFIINTITLKFQGQKIIVRSSAVGEDDAFDSMAGRLMSIMDVDSNNRIMLVNAITEVFAF